MTAPYCGPIQAGWRCRLGPLVMTGLAALGAAVGIGWLCASSWIPTHEPTDRRVLTGRSLALVSMAFCEGIAVLGVVVGILAVMTDGQIGLTDELLAAGPAVVGAVIGLGLVVRHRRTADPRLVPHAVVFIVGLANLGIVVALLAYILGEDGRRRFPRFKPGANPAPSETGWQQQLRRVTGLMDFSTGGTHFRLYSRVGTRETEVLRFAGGADNVESTRDFGAAASPDTGFLGPDGGDLIVKLRAASAFGTVSSGYVTVESKAFQTRR